MRATAAILVAAAAVLTPSPGWAKNTTANAAGSRPVPGSDQRAGGAVPSGSAAPAPFDFAQLFVVAQGSPVAVRYRRVAGRNGRAVRATSRDLAAFRATQDGAFDQLIADAAERWNIDPFLLKGLLYNESRLEADLVGKRMYRRIKGRRVAVGGGARGIAQFTSDGVHAVNELRERRRREGASIEHFDRADVMVPELAIPAAAELLASYIDRFGRDGGITAYNSGPAVGKLVAKLGFFRARRSGRLSRLGLTQLQGHRFLPNVLRWTNHFRREAGRPALPGPHDRRFGVERTIERLIDRSRAPARGGEPNS
jgi:soluble lytic murein transglycosylase-like protein